MKLHANAALSWSGRRELARRGVDQGWTLRAAAEAAGVSVRCARRWSSRYREGDRRLLDRSSAPRRVANRTDPGRVAVIMKLRGLRMTAAEIAETLAMPLSTVSGILTRGGLGRLGRIVGGAGWRVRGGRQHRNRVLTDASGKPRRTVGYEYVHVAVDDYSRLAYVEVLPNEQATSTAAFLQRAVAYYRRYGIHVEAILTDNAAAYRGVIHTLACRKLGIKHLRTRPYRPQTNGKAERFIRTLINGWAYGAIYRTSNERTQALDGWLFHYNHQRRHSALGHQPPISRTNLLGSYI